MLKLINLLPVTEQNVIPLGFDRQSRLLCSHNVLKLGQNHSFGPTGPTTDTLARLLQRGLSLGKLAGGYGEIRSHEKPADGTKPPLLGFITRNPEAKQNNQNGGVLITVEHDSIFIAANVSAPIAGTAIVEEAVAAQSGGEAAG